MDAVSSSTSIGQGNSTKNCEIDFDNEDKHTNDEVDQDTKSNVSKQKSSSSGAGKSKGKQANKSRRPHLQGRFSGRLETKTDEKRLVDECRLLGPLLGGVGKRGEKSRLTLAKIVRGIASGDIRRHCELREKRLNEMKQKVTDLETGQLDVQVLRKDNDSLQAELLERQKECETLKQKLHGQAAVATAATSTAAGTPLINGQSAVAAMPVTLTAGGSVSPLATSIGGAPTNAVQVPANVTASAVQAAAPVLSQTVLQPSAVLAQGGATLQAVVKPEQLTAVQPGPAGLQVTPQLVVPAAQQQGGFVGGQNIQIISGSAFADASQAVQANPVMSGPQTVAPQVQVSAQGPTLSAVSLPNGSVALVTQGQLASVGMNGLNQTSQLVVSQPQQVVEQPQANAQNLQYQAESLGAQAQQQSLQAQAHAQLQAEASAQMQHLVAQANIHEIKQAQAAAQADHLKRVASAGQSAWDAILQATSENEDKQTARHVQDLEIRAREHAEAAFLSRAKAQELAATAQAHSHAHATAQVQAQTLAVQAQSLQVAAHRFETSVNVAQQQIAAQHSAQLYAQQSCMLQNNDQQQQQFNQLDNAPSMTSFPTSSGSAAAQLPRVVHQSAANLLEVGNTGAGNGTVSEQSLHDVLLVPSQSLASASSVPGPRSLQQLNSLQNNNQLQQTGTIPSGLDGSHTAAATMQVPTVTVVHSGAGAAGGTAPSQNINLSMQLNAGSTLLNTLALEQPIQLVQAAPQCLLNSQASTMRQDPVVNVIQTQPVAIQQAVVDVKQAAPTITTMSNGMQIGIQNMTQLQAASTMLQPHDNVLLYSNQQVVQQVTADQLHAHMLQHTNSQNSQNHASQMNQGMGPDMVLSLPDNQLHSVVGSRAPDMLMMESPLLPGSFDISNLGLTHDNNNMPVASMAACSLPLSGTLNGLI